MRQSVGVRVENPITWFRAEFRRENLEARERRAKWGAKQLEHPVLSTAIAAVVWGTIVWLVSGRETDLSSLLGLAVASVFFGSSMLLWVRRWNRKHGTSNAQGASNGG